MMNDDIMKRLYRTSNFTKADGRTGADTSKTVRMKTVRMLLLRVRAKVLKTTCQWLKWLLFA
jgi:hypothetical protein